MNKQARHPTSNPAWKCLRFLGILLLAQAPSTAYGQQLFAGDATVTRLTPVILWHQSDHIITSRSIGPAEIRRATHRDHRWSGLAIGAVAGGTIGALVGLGNFEPLSYPGNLSLSCSVLSFVCPDDLVDPLVEADSRPDEHTTTGIVAGALIGGGLGFLVGKMLGHWETVELDQLTVAAGNVAVSMRIRR